MARLTHLLLRLAALAALHSLASRAQRQQPSVAICVAIKDQAVDVREWVYYHRAIGAWGTPGRLKYPSSCPELTPRPTLLQAWINFTFGTRAASRRCW